MEGNPVLSIVEPMMFLTLQNGIEETGRNVASRTVVFFVVAVKKLRRLLLE